MKKFIKSKNSKGSSIIELLIAVVIVGSIVTATAIGMTYTIKNSSETRYRELASTVAQDGIELFKRERVTRGWADFYTQLGTSPSTMCINGESPVFDTTPSPCGTTTFPLSKNTYQREAKITKLPVPPGDPQEVEIQITVRWNQLGTPDERRITVTQVLKDRF